MTNVFGSFSVFNHKCQSTNPVFTKQNEMPFTKKVKQRCQMILMKLLPFQRDYVMCEDVHVHHRANASRAFVVKKCINIIFSIKLTNRLAR